MFVSMLCDEYFRRYLTFSMKKCQNFNLTFCAAGFSPDALKSVYFTIYNLLIHLSTAIYL